MTNGMAPGMLMKEISMPISASLLAVLACPLCQADVKLTADEKGLKCVSCHRVYPIKDDQQFILDMLEAEKVLVVQGTGFNWPNPDHIRIVFLPNSDDLTEAIGRIARFLESYRRRRG